VATVGMQRAVICWFMMKIKRRVGGKKMLGKKKYTNVN
jgi:hypothetical protein